MDRQELIGQLQRFKQACYDKNYIDGELYLDEAYPGIVPTSYIVNMVAQKQWLDDTRSGNILDRLIDVLWETTVPAIRKNIFTLNIMTLEEMVNSERQRDRKRAATNPGLTAEQIKKLFHDPKILVKREIINHIQTGALTEQLMQQLFETDDEGIKGLLISRIRQDGDLMERVLKNSGLKLKYLQNTI